MADGLTIRSQLSDADGIVALFRDVYGGRYPAPELCSPDKLRSRIREGSETYFAALQDGAVVGCASTRILKETEAPDTSEHIADLGRLCTSRALPNRAQVATAICRFALAHSEQQGARGWYATMRSGASLRIGRALGFIPVGFTEEHVVGSERERHVIALRTTSALVGRRVFPPNAMDTGSVYCESLVRNVSIALKLANVPVANYPNREFVGDPDVPTEIVRYQSSGAERRVRVLSLPLMRATYADAIVLSDKTDKIAMLREQGWRLTAFLPAWHELRFDCVVLSTSRDLSTTTDKSLLKCVKELSAGGEPGSIVCASHERERTEVGHG